MGLDQAFFTSEKEFPVEEVIQEVLNAYELGERDLYDEIEESMETDYSSWLRKIPALHQYYVDRVAERAKGTFYESYDINNVYVLTSKAELLHLKALCLIKGLDEEAAGFFWGQHHDDHYSEIIEAVDEALEAIEEGKYVYYYGNY